jgi:hypothetical protein
MLNLFKGYSKASDKAFKDYISKKEAFYEEGGPITTDKLTMVFTLPSSKLLPARGFGIRLMKLMRRSSLLRQRYLV